MLKKFLTIFGFLISCNFSFAHPQDGMSPEQLMFHYVKMFNEENLPALQDIFHSPHNVGYWQILSLNSIGNVAGMNK